MRFKRWMLITLILFLTIISISFVGASENVYGHDKDLNTVTVSDVNSIDEKFNTVSVDSVDESKDSSLGTVNEDEKDEIENEDCLTYNETQLLRFNDVEEENDVEDDLEILGAANGLNVLGASNGVEILGASNDDEILGAWHDTGREWHYNPSNHNNQYTVQGVLDEMRDLSNAGGGILYLDHQYYTGGGNYYNSNGNQLNNVWVIGGESRDDTRNAEFAGTVNFYQGWYWNWYNAAEISDCRFTHIVKRNTGRLFDCIVGYDGNSQTFSGSMTNTVFDYCESLEQFIFFMGNEGNAHDQYNIDVIQPNGQTYKVNNVSFINCKHTYNGFADGVGQFVAALGMTMDNCNFINVTSGQHASGICVNDETGFGPGYLATTITNTNFINLTAKWFAVYIHGRYDGETGMGAPNHNHLLGQELVENCTFINCAGTKQYGGGLGTSHDDLHIVNCTFINNTGGQGSAIMVGGIAATDDSIGRYAFGGDNTKGNNIVIDGCTFKDCTADVHDSWWEDEDGNRHEEDSNGIGGAVFIVGNNTQLLNSVFDNNTGTNGSAVYIYGIGTKVVNTNFTNNDASIDGAVYILGANTNITDSRFEDNTAINGAGVYIRGENTYIANTEFTNNTADPNVGLGGAIDVIGDHCTLVTVTCNNNSANCGGAGFIRGNNTVVRNSTFDNNKAALRGGGLDVFGNNFNANDLDVSGNVAETEGGAVYVVGNDAKFTYVTSINNTASRGGSTFVQGNSTVITNCKLDNNKAISNGSEGSGRGGGIDLAGENCEVHDLEVSNNFATNEGGAIYIKSDSLEIFKINSTNNTAALGGSTYIYGNDIEVHDCKFDGNNATLRGGGLNIYGDNCTVYNVDVSDNVAGTDGGAVYVLGDYSTFRNVTSINNTAARGGSTFIRGNYTEVYNCTLDGNKALFNGTEGSGRGGGLDVAGEDCKIYDLDVSHNRADREGGAIYIKSSDLHIYDIYSVNNTAERGGSVFIEGDNITVSNSTFNNNEAIFNESRNETSGLGGAIDIAGDNCSFIGVTSVNNSAYRGGSTFIRGNNTLIKNCTLDNNTATLRGGGINVAGDNCTVENVDLSNNKAGLMGGGMYVLSDSTSFTNVIADNNTAERGGAAFINGTNINVTDSEFNNNRAIHNESRNDTSGLGGAFDIVGNNILVDNVTSNNNTAYRGGSSFIRGSNVTVQNSNLDNNSADLRGGALNIGGGDGCQIINVSVSNNHAEHEGGAVYVVGDKALFDNVTSIHNTAEEGGSSYIAGNEVKVINCNLDNNSASVRGGGLAVTGDNCTFVNVALSNCNATEEGGAVYVKGENSVFDNVTSIHNTANKGGSSFIEGNNITVKNCNLDENSADSRGGGLDVKGDNCTFVNVTLSNCYSGIYGGAVYVNGTNNTFDNVTSVNNIAEFAGGSSYIIGNETTVKNCILDNNYAPMGGAICLLGDDGEFLNNSISNNNAFYGGGAYIEGNNSLFDSNDISSNNAELGGGIFILNGDNSTFINNNITFNYAYSEGGGAYVSGPNTNLTNNNISSNHADGFGGGMYCSGENLTMDSIYAFNNTAQNGGFAAVEKADNFVVAKSTFISNHALGDDIEKDVGEGGAFHLANSDNVEIEGEFRFNTAINGSAIYADGKDFAQDPYSLRVHDSVFYDNQARSYLLIATGDTHNSTADSCPCNGSCDCPIKNRGGDCNCPENCSCRIMSIYRGENITIIVYHKGGDNIANAIYNRDYNVTVNNISYPFYTVDGQEVIKTTPEQDIPIILTVPDPDEIYEYPFENNQVIIIEIYNNETGALIRNATYAEIPKTDINGATYLLLEGLPTGNYTVRAYYRESTYYTAINNVTKFRVIEPPMVDKLTVNETVFLGQNVDFVVVVNNTLTDDNGTGVVLHNVTITEIFRTSELEYVDHTNKEKWVIGGNYTITEIVGGESVEYTCLILNYQGTLDFYESSNFTITFKTLVNGTLINTVNLTTNETGNYTAYNNTTVVPISINVTKIWYDGDNSGNTRPDNITVELLADGVVVNSTVLSNATGWKYTFMNLPLYNGTNLINYTIREFTVPNYRVNITKGANREFIIENTLVTNVTVIKIWNDADNQDGVRPVNITVQLIADGVVINSTVLSNETGWNYTWYDLPVYRENGTVIVYTVNETAVADYSANITRLGNYSFMINNTHVPAVTNVTVIKIWNDGNNALNTRPAYITVELLADGVVINSTILSNATGWNHTWYDLPVYKDNGTAMINYDIIEFTVDNYIVNLTKVDNTTFVINNTLVTDINVTKIWNDGNNALNTRPASIVVELLADGVSVGNGTLNQANGWKYTFTELPVFNGDNFINYTVTEFAVDNYIVNITKVDNFTFVINNTLVTVVNVTKIWNDGNNALNTRPASIVVELLADGVSVGNGTLNQANGWKYTFTELPVYRDNGIVINYNVSEFTVENYIVNLTQVDNTTFVINNTLVTVVNVTKIWNDNNNASGARPGSIVVDLLADGVKINETTLIPDAWFGSFVDLPVYNGTHLINYTVRENTTLPNWIVRITNMGNGVFVIENTLLVDVSVVKTVDRDQHTIDDVVVWTITVFNAANGTNATNVVLNDTFPPAGFIFVNYTATPGTVYNHTTGIWNIGVMGNGTNVTLVIRTIAKQNGTFTNHANVTCAEDEWNYTNNYDNATVVIVGVPINKTVNNATPFYNANVTYNLTVTNIGNYTYLDNITVIDSLPEGLTYIDTVAVYNAVVVVNATVVGNNVTWVITHIDPNTTAIISVLVNVHAINNLTNNETVILPNGTNMTVNCTVVPRPYVDVSVNKTVDRDEHVIDDLVVWTVTVYNAANGTNATNVVLNDTFPPVGFDFVNYTTSDGSIYDHATGVWNIGFMGNGTNVTLVIRTIAKQNGTFTNEANVTCNETEWNYANNYDNATLRVVDFPIVKTVNNATPYYNTNVTYNLTVTNVGIYNYTQNITIVDTLPEGVYFIGVAGYYNLTVLDGPIPNGNTVTWVVTGIAPNTTGIISIDVWVHAVNTLINNETMILPNGTNKTVGVPIEVQPIVDVSVVKTADKFINFVDDTVVWTITVSNAANGTNATNVVLKDTFPAGFTVSSYKASAGKYNTKTGVWTIGFMGNGTSETLTIKSIAKAKGVFTNHANVTSKEKDWNLSNNYDNATVIVFDMTDVEKTVNNTTPYQGEYVLYNITITNVGNVTYKETLTVEDSLPEGLEYIKTVSITGAKVVKGAVVKGQVVTWKITNIDPNVPAVITIKARANAVGTLVNNATVIGPDGTSKTVNCTIKVKPICDVEIIKLVNLKKVYVGENVIWTIKVTNKGPSTAKNVVVTDQLPKALKAVSYKVTKGSFDMESCVWTIKSLAKGASATLTLTTKVIREGVITNPVSVNTTTKESNYTNNKAKNTTKGIPIVDLELKKYADKTVYHKGDKMHWTIVVVNHGPSTATGVVVSDVMPSGVKYIRYVASKGSYDKSTGKWDIGELAKGESATIEIYCNVTAESGSITNYASVTCNEHDSNPDNNKDSATITVEPEPQPVPPKMHPTGNPIVMVFLSLLAIVGVTLRRKL